MNHLDQWLWLIVLQTTFLLGGAAGLCRWLPLSPIARHAIGVAAVLFCCVLPILSCVLPPTFSKVIIRLPSPTQSMAPTTVELSSFSVSELVDLPTENDALSRSAQATGGMSQTVYPQSARRTIPRTAWWLVAIWVSGSLVMFVRRVSSHWALNRRLGSAQPLPMPDVVGDHLRSVFGWHPSVDLYSCETIICPFVIGWWRSRIFLPQELVADQDRLRQVVTHECAHIHRHDTAVLLLQQIGAALFWWQPLMRSVNHEIAAARESIADMYVLARCDALSYAETLLTIAVNSGRVSSTSALALFAQPQNLEQRVGDIIDNKYSLERCHGRTAGISTVLLATAIAFGFGGVIHPGNRLVARDDTFPQSSQQNERDTASADDGSQLLALSSSSGTASADQQQPDAGRDTDSGPVISGQVQDAEGLPVADCQVISRLRNTAEVYQSITTVTDSRGHFSLTFPRDVYEVDTGYTTWFYKRGHGLKAVAFAKRLAANAQPDRAIIVLPKATSIAVQVQDPTGRPVAGAKLRAHAYSVSIMLKTDGHAGPDAVLPPELLDPLQATTDAEGRAVLAGYDSKLLRGLQADSQEYGQQSVTQWNIGNSLTLRLKPTSAVRVQLHSPEPAKFAGTDVLLISRTTQSADADPVNDGAVSYAATKVTLDERGQFYVPAIASGDLVLMVRKWPHKQEVLPLGPTRTKLVPGQTAQINIELTPSVEITGKVIVQDGHTPVAGAGVAVLPDVRAYRGRSPLFRDEARTTSDGAYRLYTTPGETQVRCALLSEQLAAVVDRSSGDQKVTVPFDTRSVQWPTIELRKSPKVVVHLADHLAQPISAAPVIVAAEIDNRVRYLTTVTTDASGAAELPYSVQSLYGDSRIRSFFFVEDDFDESQPSSARALRVVRQDTNSVWLQRH